MKDFQVSKKLLSVVLLVSVVSQAAAFSVPGWETAKELGGNVATFFKPYDLSDTEKSFCNFEADRLKKEGGFKNKVNAYYYQAGANHPKKLYAAKLATVAAVAAGLGYGAYQLYNKYFNKKSLSKLEDAVVKASEAKDKSDYITKALESMEGVLAKLDKTDRDALTKAAKAFENAIGAVIEIQKKGPAANEKVRFGIGEAFVNAGEELDKQMTHCNEVLSK